MNAEIVEPGVNGFLAQGKESWRKSLAALLSNPAGKWAAWGGKKLQPGIAFGCRPLALKRSCVNPSVYAGRQRTYSDGYNAVRGYAGPARYFKNLG